MKKIFIIIFLIMLVSFVGFVSAGLIDLFKSPFYIKNSIENTFGDLNSGLIHEYNFEDNLKDSTKNSDFNLVKGNVEYSKAIVGNGVRLSFDDVIKTTNKLLINEELTINFWINFKYSKGININKIDNKNKNFSGFVVKLNDKGIAWFTGGKKDKLLKCKIDDFVGEWHNIALTAGKENKIYVDGKLCAKNARLKELESSKPLSIQKLDGVIDNFRIWNRILTEHEINNIVKEQDSQECVSDFDCVPATCCHPSSCVSIDKAPMCKGVFCTLECKPGTLDCGQGSCMCINGRCNAVFK